MCGLPAQHLVATQWWSEKCRVTWLLGGTKHGQRELCRIDYNRRMTWHPHCVTISIYHSRLCCSLIWVLESFSWMWYLQPGDIHLVVDSYLARQQVIWQKNRWDERLLTPTCGPDSERHCRFTISDSRLFTDFVNHCWTGPNLGLEKLTSLRFWYLLQTAILELNHAYDCLYILKTNSQHKRHYRTY
jgi:hypothetical protein